MPVTEHCAPMHEGESCMDHPKADDPRIQPFFQTLKRFGVIDDNGIMLKPMKLMRGVGPDGYMWRAEWEDGK